MPPSGSKQPRPGSGRSGTSEAEEETKSRATSSASAIRARDGLPAPATGSTSQNTAPHEAPHFVIELNNRLARALPASALARIVAAFTERAAAGAAGLSGNDDDNGDGSAGTAARGLKRKASAELHRWHVRAWTTAVANDDDDDRPPSPPRDGPRRTERYDKRVTGDDALALARCVAVPALERMPSALTVFPCLRPAPTEPLAQLAAAVGGGGSGGFTRLQRGEVINWVAEGLVHMARGGQTGMRKIVCRLRRRGRGRGLGRDRDGRRETVPVAYAAYHVEQAAEAREARVRAAVAVNLFFRGKLLSRQARTPPCMSLVRWIDLAMALNEQRERAMKRLVDDICVYRE